MFPQYNVKYFFHMGSVWYQNRVKRVRGVYLCRNVRNVFKYSDFGYALLKRVQIKCLTSVSDLDNDFLDLDPSSEKKKTRHESGCQLGRIHILQYQPNPA